jgi:hemoglobin
MKTQIPIIKSLAIVMTLAALLVATVASQTEKSLYERLGGVFAIVAVVDHFSDAIVQNPTRSQAGRSNSRQQSQVKLR